MVSGETNPNLLMSLTIQLVFCFPQAKILELQSLNLVLENPDLNSAAFQKWRSEHEHLYGTLGTSPQAQRAVASYIYQEKKSNKSNRDSRESEESD